MRRPSALPAPRHDAAAGRSPASPPEAADDVRMPLWSAPTARPAEPQQTSEASADADTAEITEVIPDLAGPHRRRSRDVGAVADRSAPRPAAEASPAGATAPGPVRLRDLWKAARARRRAERAQARRFTARARHRRALWLGALGVTVVVLGGAVGMAYSPLFAVRQIRVEGTHTVSATSMKEALASQEGVPLPMVDASAVKAALARFPRVETYTLQARPPHELVVVIRERTPVGVVKKGAGYTLVDAAGVALDTTATVPAGRAVLSADGGIDSPAFRALGQVMRALPAEVRSLVASGGATTPDDITLVLKDTGTKVVWGGATDSAMKALLLQKAMKIRPPAQAAVYDVSSAPDAITVR